MIGNTKGSSGWVKTDLLGAEPMLGPLQDNGGPTWTMALLPGSPAIGAGSATIAGVTTTDQRGVPRPSNRIDIGAYEFLFAAANDAISVGWGTQTAALQTAADGLRLLPAGRNTDLPWLGIYQLQVTLSQASRLTPADVTLYSAISINYGPVTISGSGTSYTITLAQPISPADRVTLSSKTQAFPTSTAGSTSCPVTSTTTGSSAPRTLCSFAMPSSRPATR